MTLKFFFGYPDDPRRQDLNHYNQFSLNPTDASSFEPDVSPFQFQNSNKQVS